MLSCEDVYEVNETITKVPVSESIMAFCFASLVCEYVAASGVKRDFQEMFAFVCYMI